MRRTAAAGLATLAAAGVAGSAPAAAAPAKVDVMIVGRTKVLRAARTVSARATTVQVGSRRCAVGAGTPLAALVALGPSFRMRDYGCGADSLFVEKIGRERVTGLDGWVYKIGHRAPGVSAGSPRVRTGTRVLWFWCRTGGRGCQRTLEVTASAASVAPGAAISFTVRGYDDRGRGAAIAGALVRFAGTALRTGADGTVATTAPGAPGRAQAIAQARGLVPSFPLEVAVR
jgi:hypothetical protein